MGRLLATAAAVGTMCLAGAPAAAAPRGTLFGFGDSLLDLTTVCPMVYPSNPNGACGNGQGLFQRLVRYAPFTLDLANDRATGGAGTGSYNVAAIIAPGRANGTLDQVNAFVAAGDRIGARDLTVVTGRNNFRRLGASSNGAALAVEALGDVDREIGGLVGAGARDLVYFDSRSPDSYLITGPTRAQVDIYEANFSAGLPAALAAHASAGVRLRIFNFTGLTAAVAANPQRFGFTSLSCRDEPGCYTGPAALQNQHLLFDQHPTEAGYDLIARYIANLQASADGIAAQADVAAKASDGFSDALLGRASLAAMGTERGLFVEGGYDRDRRRTAIGDSGAALGYRDHVGRVVVGVTAPLAAGLTVGGAFGYAHSSATLSGGGGDIHGRTYQGGAFAGWRRGHAFADATIGYAHHDLSVDRAGVIDGLSASPNASTIFAQARGGYLFDVSGLRAGPVVRLAYDRTRVRSYTEAGDPLLAQSVGGTTAKGLLGRAGVRAESGAASPVGVFVEAAAAHDFDDGRRVLTTANLYAPDLPIQTVVPGRYRDRTFGEVSAGLSAPLVSRVRLLVQGDSSFARRGGNGYAIQAGVHVGL